MLPPSSGSERMIISLPRVFCSAFRLLPLVVRLVCSSIITMETTFLRNVRHSQDYTALNLRRLYPSQPIYLWLYSLLFDLGLFFSFLILYTIGKTPWTGDQPAARPLPIHRTTQTQNKRTQTSMSWVGFEPTTPAFKRANTVHALVRVRTVIGALHSNRHEKVKNPANHFQKYLKLK
jgi:hypothetical protein